MVKQKALIRESKLLKQSQKVVAIVSAKISLVLLLIGPKQLEKPIKAGSYLNHNNNPINVKSCIDYNANFRERIMLIIKTNSKKYKPSTYKKAILNSVYFR